MATYLKNPPLNDNEYPETGETRVQNGVLECTYQGAWFPAVRQHTIRAQLLYAADMYGSYMHARPEDDKDTNRTAYLHRDQNYGEEWAHLPPIIYELYPPANRRAVKPRDVLRDASNRIMLDPYDHPIRDFPGELPIVLSNTLHGVWVEYYLRSNREIKVYDLIARMGFVARDNKPVRTARLTERATKFRKAAACSTWNDKTGSAEIRQAIVNLLPPGTTNTRSLGGYLSKSQLDMLYNVNRGTAGNRARKTAREARAAQASAANLVGQSSQPPATRPRKTKTVSSNSRRTVNTTVSNGQRDNSQGQSGSVPRGENKRSRDHTKFDLAVQNTSPPLAKRPRPEESLGGAAETDYLPTEPQAPERGADEAFFEDTDAGFDTQEKKRQKIRPTMGTVVGSLASTQRNSRQAIDPAAMLSTGHNKRTRTNTRIPAPLAPTHANDDTNDDANNPFNSPDSVFSPQSFGYDHANDEYVNSVDSLCRDWSLPSSQQPTTSNANSRLKRATHTSVGARGTEASRQEHEIQINKRPTTVGAGPSQPYPNTSQDQTSKTSHQTCKRPSGGDASPLQPYLKPSHTQTCRIPSQTNKQTSVGRAAFQQRFSSTSTSGTPQIDDLINHAQDNASVPDHHKTNNTIQDARGPSTAKTVPIIDPGKDDAFQAECMAGIIRHDYRYFHPNLDNESPDETTSLRSALDLTRIDFMLKTGQDFPAELADKYQNESYATQHWRLQKHFEAIWHGPGSAPMLYRLQKDFFGWNTWPTVIDQLGQWLYDIAHEKGWMAEEEL